MTFLQLFKNSTFARYNPRIPFIFSKNYPEKVMPDAELQFEASNFDAQFGIKREPPKRQHGKPLDFISITSLDGDFGLPEFTDSKDRVLKNQIFSQLQRLGSSGLASLRIPGRVLESCEGGFLIGIGPVRAHLPQSEIPAGINFNYYDMLDKKAYNFYLKSIRAVVDKSRKRSITTNTDIFSSNSENQNISKMQPVPTYSKRASDQGFHVILTLRK